MPVITVNNDIGHVKSIYTKYFRYERKRALRKFPFYQLSGLCFAVFLLGLAFNPSVMFIGLGSFIGSLCFTGSYFLRYNIQCRKYLSALEQHMKNAEPGFIFGFNASGMTWHSELWNSEVKWELIRSYEENGTELYLFMSNRKLCEIISSEILGRVYYEELKQQLNLHLTR